MLKSQIQLSQYDRCQTQLSKEFKQCRPLQIYQSALGFPRFSRGKAKQEAISQKEIVFRFRKDIHSEKGWKFDILCMRSPGVKGICADALLCDSLSCQSLRFVVEARSVGFCRGSRVEGRG